MPKPCSQDLRDRVIDAVERGKMSRRAAARHYAVSESVAKTYTSPYVRTARCFASGARDASVINRNGTELGTIGKLSTSAATAGRARPHADAGTLNTSA